MSVTPLRRQYLRVKEQYPGAIVLFRLGDFYETFDDDARVAAAELDIVLTSREMGKGNRVPMAGIPYHALDNYLGRLVGKGLKVAICEQVTPPGNGLVEREVVRVVTPGTLTEPALLRAKSNNYLLSVRAGREKVGLAYCDVSTGEFAVTEVRLDAFESEISRLMPVEVLAGNSVDFIDENRWAVTRLDDYWYEEDVAHRLLLDHLEVATLEGYGCARLPLAIEAAGALLHYLGSTQRESLRHITSLSTYWTDGYMTLDGQTIRNLELYEGGRWGTSELSLLSILDETRTSMGARLLRNRLGSPLVEVGPIEERLSAVAWFHENALARQECRSVLSDVADIERLIGRVSAARAIPREVAALRASLKRLPALCTVINASPISSRFGVHPLPDIVGLLDAAISDEPGQLEQGGVIRHGYSSELDELRSRASDARSYLADLESRERERTGIKSLKVGYNRVFGYYIEISRSNLHAVPDGYMRKQTLAEAERFYTPELKEYETLVLTAGERIAETEQSLYREVCEQVSQHAEAVSAVARGVAALDVAASLAEVAAVRGYVRPTLDESLEIDIRGGRHPIVEARLKQGEFVANDTYLSNDESQIVVLTGPNMSGKSTYLRQVALIVLMAQVGSFVPAEAARIGVVDRIFTRVGAQEDLASGQSTFMVEMIETANILHHAGPRSLLVLDEIGRGTSTYDGISIAWAVAEYIHNSTSLGSKTVFATHYHELVELSGLLPRVVNQNVAVVEEGGTVRLLHRIVPGGADRSYGIHVAKLAGLPREVLSRAQGVLDRLEDSARSRTTGPKSAAPSQNQQLALFGPDSGLAKELSALPLDSITPLEAMNLLYELRDRARNLDTSR